MRITIQSIEDARPYAGKRVKLFFGDSPRGAGVLQIGRATEIGVGSGGYEGVGVTGVDALHLPGATNPLFSLEVDDDPKAIEIRTEADARQWVGRRVRLFRHTNHRGREDRGEGMFAMYVDGVGDVRMVTGGDPADTRQAGTWCGAHAYGQYATIELLDGPAHPRPEGDGWVWAQTSAEIPASFLHEICEISAPSSVSYPARLVKIKINEILERALLGHLPSGPSASLDMTARGGAWIRRENTADPTPEPPPVSPPDPVPATREERLAQLQATIAAATAEIAETEAEIAQEAEDARFPLPEGYTWLDGSCAVYWHKLSAVRAVLARHDAENPQSYSVSLEPGQMLASVPHDFAAGDRVRLTHEDGRETIHAITGVDYGGDSNTSRLVGHWGGRTVTKITRL